MTPERWQRLQALFHRTVGLTAAERARLLERECAGDEELRGEVEVLVAADGEAAGLAVPIGEVADQLAAGGLAPGERVGPFRVVREVGRGGMGVVYLAERTGQDFEQRVALKVLAGIVASPRALGRFLVERRILAQLEHPHIARLLDGGATAWGAPWFAMEWVEGEPIDAWCDRRRLPVGERLALMLAVCDAVAHAHRRLVVHRDLKPSNIVVGADRAPKLLDFGIAKLLDPETEGPVSTRLGELPMTPEYASPEQVRGGPVTTASDVYALGLLLYELLTGHRAHRLTGRGSREVELAVCEQPATRPSLAVTRSGGEPDAGRRQATPEQIAGARRTTVAALRRRLAGDLDTIVEAALRKEPERRYGSVEALADDLRRHLDGLPVRARGGRLGYRVAKLVRRHRAAFAAAVLAAVSLAAAAGTSTYGLLRARAAEAEARRAAAAAEQVATFLEELFAQADPGTARGADLTAREILDAGTARIRDGLGDQPAVRARLLYVLGSTYEQLGSREQAVELLEEAAALQTRQSGADHPDTLRTVGKLGGVLTDLGRLDDGERVLREALPRAEASLGADHPVTLAIRSELGLAAWELSDFGRAAELLGETLAGRRRVLGREHTDTLASMNNLALVYQAQGSLDEAERLLREAVEVGTRVRGRDHPATLDALNNLGMNVARRGRYAEAADLIGEAYELRRRVLGPEHPRTLRSMIRLADLYGETERLDAAERLLLDAAEVQDRTLGADHPDTLWTRFRLAEVYLRRGELERAEELAQTVLEQRRAVFGPGPHYDVLWSIQMLGSIALERGRPAEAERLFRRATEGFEQSEGADSRDALLGRLGVADSLTALSRPEEAERLVADARRRVEDDFPNDARLGAKVLLSYGRCLHAAGRLREAGEALRSAREKAGDGNLLATEITAEIDAVAAAS